MVTAPEYDDEGRLIGLTGSLMDVTEKKKMELLQQDRAEEAIELRRAQERFIDMTSHEMRNPLSAISLSADASAERLEDMLHSDSTVARKEGGKAELSDTLEDLKIITHCCVHMTRLIDDVLTLSKLGKLIVSAEISITLIFKFSPENQFLIITPVPSRPVDFISETLSVFKGEMISKDIACELEITNAFQEINVDTVLTDPSRINQLVINILTNAIKVCA